MNGLNLSVDEVDALTELTNIGMGRAGAKLSEVFQSKVKLTVPKVEVVNQDKIVTLIKTFGDNKEPLNIVQQEFIGEMVGHSSILFGGDTLNTLMEFLGYDELEAQSIAIRKEILSELTNVINSASLSGLAEELELSMHLSQPAIIGMETYASSIDSSRLIRGNIDSQVLLIDIKMELEAEGVHCDNIISLRDEGLDNLISSLRKLMA